MSIAVLNKVYNCQYYRDNIKIVDYLLNIELCIGFFKIYF